jgi:hypothetical protein
MSKRWIPPLAALATFGLAISSIWADWVGDGTMNLATLAVVVLVFVVLTAVFAWMLRRMLP